MEIYLIRHTTPAIEKGICYGQSDVPLAESFQQEADTLLRQFTIPMDAVYSSKLKRCYTLACQLKTLQPAIQDDRLLEMNFGNWEMKKWDAIDQLELNAWMTDFVNVKTPGGENFIALNTRVQHFMDELIKRDHKRIAIVTHAGVIRSFLVRVLEIPLRNTFKIPVDYASVTKITLGEDNCFSKVDFLNRQ